jgi:restriction endonuclease S subunit
LEIDKLPKHWQLKKLGEVCGIVYGKGLPVKELKPSGFPVFGANGIIGFNDKYLFEGKPPVICILPNLLLDMIFVGKNSDEKTRIRKADA